MSLARVLAAFAALSTLSLGAASATEYVSIGTGGVTGVYYPTGGAICRMVNKNKKKHGVRCLVESTAGSVYNINAIRAGELDMGIAQSDWQYHAVHGTAEKSFIEAGPFQDLRAVFSGHGEPVTIIARADANIKHVDDLVGKRVNIGNPGSGTEATWNLMWETMGHENGKADLQLAAQLKSVETPRALCDNKIDALFFLVGHPNGLSKEATTTCDAVMVEVTGPAVDNLVENTPFYRHATIPGGMYRGNPNDTKAFGVGATFVSSTKTSENTVYVVTKAVFDNFDAFKKLHPAFANLKESEMIKDALSAPLHDGAVKYYKERGWM
jgi:hypothetical protein